MSDSKAKITAMKANRSCPHVRKYFIELFGHVHYAHKYRRKLGVLMVHVKGRCPLPCNRNFPMLFKQWKSAEEGFSQKRIKKLI